VSRMLAEELRNIAERHGRYDDANLNHGQIVEGVLIHNPLL